MKNAQASTPETMAPSIAQYVNYFSLICRRVFGGFALSIGRKHHALVYQGRMMMRKIMKPMTGATGAVLGAGFEALEALAEIVDRMMRLIWNLIRRIFGVFGMQLPPMPPRKSDYASDEEIAREGSAAEQTLEAARKMKADSGVGGLVHRYASAHYAERPGIALDDLSEDEQMWLLMLSSDDLKRLAELGPAVCENALRGKRCGIKDLPTVESVKDMRAGAAANQQREVEIEGMRPIYARIHRWDQERAMRERRNAA